MIELRWIENGSFLDLQYRFHKFTVDASGSLCPPDPKKPWSKWQKVPMGDDGKPAVKP